MRFGMKPEEFPFEPGAKLDLAVTLDLREFRGEDQLTVSVRDIKLSGLDMDDCIHSYRIYEKYLRREILSDEEAAGLTPTREELAVLYRLLISYRGAAFGLQPLLGSLSLNGFTLGKLLLCLDILEERGLVRCGRKGERMTAQVLPTQGKVDIFASPVFRALRAPVGN